MAIKFPSDPKENQIFPETVADGELQWIYVDGSWQAYTPTENPDEFVRKAGDTMTGDLVQTPGEGVIPPEAGNFTTSVEDESYLIFRYKDSTDDIKCATLELGYCASLVSDIEIGTAADGVVGQIAATEDAIVLKFAEVAGDVVDPDTDVVLQWEIETAFGSGEFEDIDGETELSYTTVIGDLGKKIRCKETVFPGLDKELVSYSNNVTVGPAPVVPVYIAWTLGSGMLSPAISNTQAAKLYHQQADGTYLEVHEFPPKILGQHKLDITDTGFYVLESNFVTSIQFSESDKSVDFTLDERSNFENVSSISYFLKGLTKFNQDLKWINFASLTSMSEAFAENTAYNQDISDWNVSQVTSMNGLFESNTGYNIPLAFSDTGNLTSIRRMFKNNSTYTASLEDFDTGNVKEMQNCFQNSTYNDPSLNEWDVSNVTNMDLMFKESSFSQDLDDWETDSLLNVNEMFDHSRFNGNISSWDVSRVIEADLWMDHNPVFNQDISKLRWNECVKMNQMFKSALSFDQDLTEWCVPKIDRLPNQFAYEGNAGFTPDKYPKWATCPPVTVIKPEIGVDGSMGGSTLLAEPTDLLVIKQTGVSDPDLTPEDQWEVQDGVDSTDFIALDGENGNTLQLTNDQSGLQIRLRQVFADDAGSTTMYSNVITVNTAPGDILPTKPFTFGFTTGTLKLYVSTNTGKGLEVWKLSITRDEQKWEYIENLELDGSLQTAAAGTYMVNSEQITALRFKDSDADLHIDASSYWPEGITSTYEMFYNCRNFDQDMSWIDTSRITDMRYMFRKASKFNGSVANWDTSKVQTISGMFWEATKFDQPLTGWSFAEVTDCQTMFQKAENFNQDLNHLRTPKLVSCRSMFSGARKMDGDFSNWDMSKIKILDNMFYGAWEFSGKGLQTWNVSNVTSMKNVFVNNNKNFTGAQVVGWDVSNVTTFYECFDTCRQLTADISVWNMSSAKNINGMFYACSNFNVDISNWNVSGVTNFGKVFDGAIAFDQPIGSWQVDSGLRFDEMFMNAIAFNQDISTWNVSSASNMDQMFHGATGFNQDISGWCVTNIKSKPDRFDQNTHAGFTTAKQPQWGTCPPPGGSRSGIATILITSGPIKISGDYVGTGGTIRQLSNNAVIHTLGVGTFTEKEVYDSCVIDTIGLTRLSFDETRAGQFTIAEDSDLEDVTTAYEMFYNCQYFNQDLTWWDTSKVTNMHGMFTKAYRFNADISTWDTSNVTDMSNMFFNMTGRSTPDEPRNIDVSGWDTSNVTNFAFTFNSASKAWNPDPSNWDVSKATVMDGMFYNCQAFDRNLNKWDTSNARIMSGMFSFAFTFGSAGTTQTGIANWDVSNATNMVRMFHEATNMQTNLSNWCVTKIGARPDMFADGCPINAVASKNPAWGTCPSGSGGPATSTLGTVTLAGPTSGSTNTRYTYTLNWTGTATFADLNVQWAGDYTDWTNNNDGTVEVEWSSTGSKFLMAQVTCGKCSDGSAQMPSKNITIS